MDKVLFAARYVEGDLNEIEFETFNEVVSKDNELREYLEYYQCINKSVSTQIKEALKPRFTKANVIAPVAETPYVAEKLTFGLDRLWYLFWVVVFVVGLMIWKPWKATMYDKYGFTENYIANTIAAAPYEGFQNAVSMIDKNNAYGVKLIVSKAYAKDATNSELAYYYGMILLLEKHYDTAKEVLYPVAMGANTAFKDKAAYLLALVYLKQENYAYTAQWLSLVPKNGAFHKLAVQLNAELVTMNNETAIAKRLQ